METLPVLVVEDNSEIRSLLVEALHDHGHGFVSAACDGLEALSLIDTLSGSVLILLDLNMPRLSGWDFLEALSAHPESGRFSVIVVSAEKDPDGASRYPQVVRIIRKPFELDDLLATVDTFLDGPRQEARVAAPAKR